MSVRIGAEWSRIVYWSTINWSTCSVIFKFDVITFDHDSVTSINLIVLAMIYKCENITYNLHIEIYSDNINTPESITVVLYIRGVLYIKLYWKI